MAKTKRKNVQYGTLKNIRVLKKRIDKLEGQLKCILCCLKHSAEAFASRIKIKAIK